MTLPREAEVGREAVCWYPDCESRFAKDDHCEACGFFRCPECRRCACDLPEMVPAETVRAMLAKTVEAMAKAPVVCEACGEGGSVALRDHGWFHPRCPG